MNRSDWVTLSILLLLCQHLVELKIPYLLSEIVEWERILRKKLSIYIIPLLRDNGSTNSWSSSPITAECKFSFILLMSLLYDTGFPI